MNHDFALAAEKVRDADWLKRVADAKGIGAEFIYRQRVAEQERRDKLAAMPRLTRPTEERMTLTNPYERNRATCP
jgi:hypothetical protein